MIETIAETLAKIAAGPGTIIALLCGVLAGFAAWAMASLSHGSTPVLSAWIGIKGFVFGIWLTYTPFAVWSLSIQLAQSWSAK